MERPGAATLKGNPLTLVGPELKAGDKAPDFDVVDNSLNPVDLAKTGHAIRIFSVVPSLDTLKVRVRLFVKEAVVRSVRRG